MQFTGLFIPEGPIVQVRDASGAIDVNEDPDPAVMYKGPLAVLVDRAERLRLDPLRPRSRITGAGLWSASPRSARAPYRI